MNRGIFIAWMVGEGIIIYRVTAKEHRPPVPGELLASSGLFILLGLLSEAQPGLASLLAWGFDAAAFLNLAPDVLVRKGNPAPSVPKKPPVVEGPPFSPGAPSFPVQPVH